MSKVVFVDTSKTAKNGKKKRKPHVCYDGEKVFEVYELTKLRNYDEIFIDTLFSEFYDEVMELLREGVKIYYLKDAVILKRLRRENNLSLPIYGEVYRKACEILGVKKSTELAILVLELPSHLPLVRLRGV
jgi:hypothetical protein